MQIFGAKHENSSATATVPSDKNVSRNKNTAEMQRNQIKESTEIDTIKCSFLWL